MNDWIEREVPISDIKTLLDHGYEIEVDSPDGYVGVNYFIDKGLWEEYLLETENGIFVSCNRDHLFETATGWVSAHQIMKLGESVNLLTKDGYVKGSIRRTGEMIPIVDINVQHDNHRYYTEGISSHNTGVGKSLFMCHCAAANLSIGKNVLYITLEMAEERIAERIDANLMNIEVDKLVALPKESYLKKVERIREKTTGKLIIKEYPTASANVSHFKHLLNELKLKRQFIPDIIYIDYLNICASARMKMGNSVNSYTYIKAIAEELRGLAVEYRLPIVSATQTTRSGYSNTDVGLEDTSESFGLPATADLMFALISSEELQDLNQIMVKQLKNRYNDPTTNKRFVIGVDRAKMKLYDAEQTAQSGLSDSGQDDEPVFDKSNFGRRERSRNFDDFKM